MISSLVPVSRSEKIMTSAPVMKLSDVTIVTYACFCAAEPVADSEEDIKQIFVSETSEATKHSTNKPPA